MVREIMRDPLFLAAPSVGAAQADLSVAQDLLDTLRVNHERCVGMAANMIGVRKNIIAFLDGRTYMVMLNPEIVKAEGEYETEEGCLSLDGIRKTKRFGKIQVRYQTEKMQWKTRTFRDYTAQIIQHEIDHCKGILI
ncbi:MAG: peptide deformylase [Clostridia bacterium]|nr:peptide deformylase [Clostridia bacterium]